MDINIDRSQCSGHGRCFGLEPELFEYDDEGFGVVSLTPVPPELEAAARRAEAGCPEQAISVES